MLKKKNLIIFAILLIAIIFFCIPNNVNPKISFIKYDDKLENNTIIPVINILKDNTTYTKDEKSIFKFISDLYDLEKNINKKTSKLRWFEEEIISKRKTITKDIFDKNILLINQIYKLLINKTTPPIRGLNSIFHYKNSLEELNDRITFYYRYMNENKIYSIVNKHKKINIFRISKHHHAVEWVFKNVQGEIGTILHADSHPDMNPIYNDVEFMKKCIDNNNFSFNNLKRIYDSVQNIGTALVPMVTPYQKNNGIIWLTPDWVKEPFCKSNIKITTGSNICYFKGNCPKFPAFKIKTKKIKNRKDKDLKLITSNVINSNKFLEEITNDYILNLDLDYFVTFGKENYLPDGQDVISDNRTIFDYSYLLKADNKIIKKKELELINEMNLIRKRIDNFLILIEKLKNKGKLPKLIIICDSTRVNFTNDQLGQEFITKNQTELVNEFTPKYLTFWLHNTVFRNLEKILSS